METLGLRRKIYIYYVSPGLAASLRWTFHRPFLLFPLLRATGVLNVEISEKYALDLEQREMIILMTYHSPILLYANGRLINISDSPWISLLLLLRPEATFIELTMSTNTPRTRVYGRFYNFTMQSLSRSVVNRI